MSQGGGSNPLEDLGNFLLQTSTFGTVGYEGGKLKAGVVTKEAIKGTKEITGAAAAEEANAMARQQMEESKVQALQARTDAQLAQQRGAIAASQAAGSAKTSTIASKTSTNKVGDVKDFLGL